MSTFPPCKADEQVEYWVYYLIGINVLAYFIFGLDKAKATRQRWRIPEKYLFLCTILGGTIGSLVGMKHFHHKTQKTSFKTVIAVIIVFQIGVLGYLVWYTYGKA